MTQRTSWPLCVLRSGVPWYWYSPQCGGVRAGYYRSSDDRATGMPVVSETDETDNEMTMQPYYEHNGITIYHGDCLEVMPTLPDHSLDAVICDPPYGTTASEWDSPIPLDAMWRELKRLIKPRGAIVLFGQEPFSSLLRTSNPSWYKYDWIWDKHMPTGYLNAKHQPLRQHELISVFCSGVATYNPLLRKGALRTKGGMRRTSSVWGQHHSTTRISDEYYPTTIISMNNGNRLDGLHPNQKPLALMEYLITTHTNPGDTILDFTAGSGTTLRAAKNLGRCAIGIEIGVEYVEVAVRRLSQEVMELAV